MSCDTGPRLGKVWLQWLVRYRWGQAIQNPSTTLGGGGCSSFIECLGKRKLWVQNACSVTPEVDRKKKETRVSKVFQCIKVLSSEFYFHKPITVHIELYLFYCFIHFLLYIGQY